MYGIPPIRCMRVKSKNAKVHTTPTLVYVYSVIKCRVFYGPAGATGDITIIIAVGT